MSESQGKLRAIAGEALAAIRSPESAGAAEVEAAFDRAGAGLLVLCDSTGAPRAVVTDATIRAGRLLGVPGDAPAARLATQEWDRWDSHPGEPAGAARLAAAGRSVALVVEGGRLAGAFLLENPNETAAFALVLAGGLGTRMGPLTDDTPKPLIPVAGKPMIEHVLRHLVRGGVRDVTIATNYLADRVEGYVGCGARYGLKINYIREEKRMGTAGALSLLDPIPKDPFFVVNADILTKLDLRAFARHHARSGAAMTLAVARHVLESPFGVVRCDGTRIVGLVEKPVTEQWVNAGLYVVSPSLVSEVPRNSYVDMTTMIGKLIARGGRVEAFAIREYWRDAGTPADLARADLELRGEPAKGEGADPNKKDRVP
jgi:dTDP-glucose pyrophosphorylase